jgi:hypothetical protein
MTVTTDSAGNVYLGDCSNDGNNSFIGEPLTDLSAQLTAFLTASGMQFQNVASQATIDSLGTNSATLFEFALAYDSIPNRYSMGLAYTNSNGGVNKPAKTHAPCMYDDSSNVFMAIQPNSPAVLTANTNSAVVPLGQANGNRSDIYCSGFSNGKAIALFFARCDFSNNQIFYHFTYAGELQDTVSANAYYYETDPQTKGHLMRSSSAGAVNRIASNTKLVRDGHYINGFRRAALQYDYTIACADSQTPTTEWATDCPIIDNEPTRGYLNTSLGGLGVRRGNLNGVVNVVSPSEISGSSNLVVGQVYALGGSVFPDNGSRAIIPVGWYNGKPLAIRCYSSLIVN